MLDPAALPQLNAAEALLSIPTPGMLDEPGDA